MSASMLCLPKPPPHHTSKLTTTEVARAVCGACKHTEALRFIYIYIYIFKGLNLPLKNPIKNHENTKKIAKSITNQQNPYQYEHIKTHQRYQNTEKTHNKSSY